MFIFGHLGIGSRLVRRWSQKLPIKWVALGTLLPDLIDKPIYYGIHSQFIQGTRSFGHTGLLLLLLIFCQHLKPSIILKAVLLGLVSHLILDAVSDLLLSEESEFFSSLPLLWPFFPNQFPIAHFKNLNEHVLNLRRPVLFISEIIGLIILLSNFAKNQLNARKSKVAQSKYG